MKSIIWADETIGREFVVGDIPPDLQKKAEAFHTQLVETVAENDDEILAQFLEAEAISEDELKASLRKSTIGAGSCFSGGGGKRAFKNKGIQPC